MASELVSERPPISFQEISRDRQLAVIDLSYLKDFSFDELSAWTQELFSAESLRDHSDKETTRFGRGVFSRHKLPSGREIFLRCYRRGGLLRHFNTQTYLSLPRQKVWDLRPCQELEILHKLWYSGIQVVKPVAVYIEFAPARVAYRASLATQYLPQAENLLALGHGALRGELRDRFEQSCYRAGMEVVKMLDLGVVHPDLHPGNVLSGENGEAILVDFDGARTFDERHPGSQAQMLVRWTRAVEKHRLPEVAKEAFLRGFNAPESELHT